jgi:hypothetical protein
MVGGGGEGATEGQHLAARHAAVVCDEPCAVDGFFVRFFGSFTRNSRVKLLGQ